jgi:hypothetical protein
LWTAFDRVKQIPAASKRFFNHLIPAKVVVACSTDRIGKGLQVRQVLVDELFFRLTEFGAVFAEKKNVVEKRPNHLERIPNDVDEGAMAQAFLFQEGNRHVARFGHGLTSKLQTEVGAADTILPALLHDPQGILQVAAGKDLLVTAGKSQGSQQLGHIHGSRPACAYHEILEVGGCAFHRRLHLSSVGHNPSPGWPIRNPVEVSTKITDSDEQSPTNPAEILTTAQAFETE